MAFYWTIDSRQKLIVATPEGDFFAEELRNYWTVLFRAELLCYRQLLDFSGATPQVSAEEANRLGVLIRLNHSRLPERTLGPLAVVLPKVKTDPTARLLGFLAATPRLMRLFHKRELAVRWLAELDSSAGGTPAPPDSGH